MAAAITLNIAELLEQILLDVDTRTVLLSQRVNKSFQAIVRGSEKLQVKLCFRQSDIPSINTLKGSDSYNTLILNFTEANPSPRWALRRHAQDLPSESSALDMYPYSMAGELYWGNLVSLKCREGDRPQKWFPQDGDETLHQSLRGLAWTRKSRKELTWTGKGIRKNKAVRVGRQDILSMSGGSRRRE
ncbi:hypothetical protein B0A48_17180 [Cryoendolithus antarcticus]|uniref:F-box domain-containing protein n=1 Tax=Cryoendolithus antarcticus TaxID=1507870 RepID=A0A1V8SC82_9PEZI|nr:hypothetical protein B0A48_17180 [Cryoendolithus antarcticus]